MNLIAWRTTIANPCDNSPVFITIAPAERLIGVFPWVLPLDRAVEIFGELAVGLIGEAPVAISLNLIPFLPNPS